jgi:hypothetical protein
MKTIKILTKNKNKNMENYIKVKEHVRRKARGIHRNTSGFSIKPDTHMSRFKRMFFKAPTIAQATIDRNDYISKLGPVIFQNKAVGSEYYKYDPSRSRQINQTRFMNSAEPKY